MLTEGGAAGGDRPRSGGGVTQLKRVPRVEGGNDLSEFGGFGRENAAFTRYSYFEDCKSVIWKMRPLEFRMPECIRPPHPITISPLIFAISSH